MQYDLLKTRWPLHYYCMVGDVENVSHILNVCADDVHSLDDFHYWTPAHFAACHNKIECLELLRVFDGLCTPSFRSTILPIHIACENGHVDALRLLLHAGSKINSQDNQGESPLHKAARRGHLNCIQVLILAGAQVNLRNFAGRTATELAAISGHFEVATTLNEVGKIKNRIIQKTMSILNDDTSRHSLNSIGTCKRHNAGDLNELLDKRRKFGDPVIQIAADIVGHHPDALDMDVSTSVLEHAATVNMSDAYANYYSSHFNSDR